MVTKDIIKIKFDNEYQGRLFAVQGETGRTYNLQVLDDLDAPINLEGMSLRLYIGNSKEVSYADGEITDAENGKVIVKLFNSQLKYPGMQMAQFVLTNKDGEKVGSKIFDLWIEEGLESGVASGKNIYVDFEKIDETLKLLKDYDVTLEEAKKVDFSLKVKIEEGTDVRNKLAECKEKAVEIKNNLDKSNADSLETYQKAVQINKTLKTQTETSTSVKNDLTGATQTAENTKQVLTSEITKANATIDYLTSTDEDAKKTDTNLKNSTSKAENVKNNLDNAKKSGETLKINLDSSISKGNNLKTDLDNSISKVPANITNLEKVINDAGNINAELKSTNSTATSTDTEAKKTIEILKSLLAQSGQTETSLKEIIASGNLDKYITDPKLQEALKDYVTKTELGAINTDLDKKIDKTAITDYFESESQDKVLSQKGAYDLYAAFSETYGELANNLNKQYQLKADKSEIPTKLSQLTNDENFKTEAEIQTLINNSTKLKKEIVTSLPSAGKEDVIYLLKNKNDTNNFYTEYMWIGGKWEIIGDTKVDLSDYAKKADIKTKLSELIDDENHRTVTDEEKQKLNNVKLSRSATFIIANYDSSENSKAGADYVIQENEDSGRVIESFISKLPEYGGKILLTEGNFKSTVTITLSGNILLEGYGNSTKIGLLKLQNSNNSIMNCSINSNEKNSIIYATGNNNSIINCSITATNNNSTAVFSICEKLSIINCSLKCNSSGISLFLGNNHLVTNCKIISNGSTIDINNEVKSSIVMGNQYIGNAISDKGTNNIVINNIKMEA